MIFISAKTPAEAWEDCFIQLYDHGIEMPENKFFRCTAAAIEIADVENNLYNDLFPVSFDEINKVSKYLLSGDGNIDHDWTKIYRKRLFRSDGNKLEAIVELLKEWPDCPRAQISVWDNKKDIIREKTAPCLQLLWFKIIKEQLVLHVHMRTCDCYGKLLLNFNEFIALQKMVAGKLNMECGEYVHFIDAFHFHEKDTQQVDDLYGKIQAKQPARNALP